MIKSKAIELLKTFSDQELQMFEAFLNSPFHNRNNRIKHLLKELKKFHHDFANEKLTEEFLFKKLYKDKKYNGSLVRNNLSDLLRAGEEFLVQIELKNLPFEKHLLVNKQLISRNLYSHFKMNLKTVLKELESSSFRDESYSYYKYQYLQQNMTITRTNFHEYDDLSGYLLETEKALAEYIAVHLGSFYTIYTSFDYVPAEKLHLILYEPALNIISELNKYGKPVIQIYYSIHMLYKTGQLEFYRSAWEQINKSGHLFRHEELKQLYICLHNFLLNKVTGGSREILIEYNQILNTFIEHGYCRNDDGTISQPFFRNVVIVKVKLKGFQAGKEFVEKYYMSLAPESQINNYHYSMAYILFYEGSFNGSMEHLAKVIYDEYLLKLQTENLILQNYYELGMYEESLYKIDSVAHYLGSHKKIPEDYYTYYSNFILFLRKLVKIRYSYDAGALDELKREIGINQSSSKSWLLEKIANLEK